MTSARNLKRTALATAVVKPKRQIRHRPARRVPVLKIALLLLLAVAGSLLLVPRGVELASLYMRWGQVERARPLLEQAYADGDRTGATIGWLARARAATGSVQGSVELLREWVAARPDDIAALELLASIYRGEPRPAEYVAALLQLQERAPTAERQRELARLYEAEGSPAQQMAALKALVERFNTAEVPDYLTLARLQERQSKPALAFATLARMVKRHPESFDASVMAAQLKAQVALGDSAAAMKGAREWLRTHPAALTVEASMFAGVFASAGRPDLAIELLEPHRAGPQASATLVTAWAQAISDSGHPGDALAGVLKFESASGDGGDADLSRLKIGLALAAGKLDVAVQAVNDLGISEVPPDLLEGLATAALSAERKDVLALVRAASDTLGAERPVLAARVAFALGDRPATLFWSNAAAAAASDDPTSAIQLARLQKRIGEPRKALFSLQAISLRKAEPDELVEYARLCVELGCVTNGLANIGELRVARPSPAADKAWALLAVSDRKYLDVLAWLNSARGGVASPDLLRDLLHLSMDGKAYPLAIAAGQQLLRQEPSDALRLTVANAMLASGRAAEALVLFRALKDSGGVRDDAYVSTLHAAWRAGAPVADELRRIALHRLANDQRSKERDAAIQTLVALGAYAELLPTLERMAESDPQRFMGLFTDAATKTGQRGRLNALWTRLAEADATPSALRSQLAFRLLEAGEKKAADRVFRALAASAAPGDEATQRLLFVWGPRPTADQLDWLESRANRATGGERAAWMRLLIDRQAAPRAIAVYKKAGPESIGPSVRDAYLDAAVAGNDKPALAAALREVAAHAATPEQRGRLAQLAANTGVPALERELLESAVVSGDGDPKLQRSLALLAWRNHDIATAERGLVAFNQRTGGDLETHRIVGDIRLKQNDPAAAHRSYEQALAALERSGETGFRVRAARANLLYRLARPREARQAYEVLLAERPNDKNLRADYVAFLMDAGDSDKAQQLLAAAR
ncbi:MAG: tetratricopeptide repeat protein [Burkholderiales bacterium]